MPLRFSPAIAISLFAAVMSGPASAGAESVAATCPAYPAHLRAARERLARGDPPGAIAELHRADQALASCLREEAAGGSLFARHDSRTRSS